uniref:Uncharacterized protein n=1 Tax=Cacopsylla melanoneura TaxID=428564 RepID=A0A8D8LXG6_9HEMI
MILKTYFGKMGLFFIYVLEYSKFLLFTFPPTIGSVKFKCYRPTVGPICSRWLPGMIWLVVSACRSRQLKAGPASTVCGWSTFRSGGSASMFRWVKQGTRRLGEGIDS